MLKKETNNLVYIQADMRFNEYLLEKINNKPIINYVIERCKNINANRIVFGEYDCPENKELEAIMQKEGITIIKNDSDVNKKFLDIVCNTENVDYVVRVCGDQPLIDTDMVNLLLDELAEKKLDYFYDKKVISIIPDIVKGQVIKDNHLYFEGHSRYFEGLKQLNLKGREMPYSMLPISIRTNSFLGFKCCKYLIEQNIEVIDVVNDFYNRFSDSRNYLATSGILNSWFLGWEADFFWNKDGKMSPWWSDSAIAFVRERLKRTMKVFEYGSGNSTFFFADIVDSVISVEHDKGWYNRMREIISNNVQLLYCELEYGGRYSKIINDYIKLDIVLIDGRDRVNCAKNAIRALAEDGIIIWDDSERSEYKEGYVYLQNNGFSRIDFIGITYGVPGVRKTTSIFYKRNNNNFNI